MMILTLKINLKALLSVCKLDQRCNFNVEVLHITCSTSTPAPAVGTKKYVYEGEKKIFENTKNNVWV